VEIDRGVAYACGGRQVDSCGLYFCDEHLLFSFGVGGYLCERCVGDPYESKAFEPTPDVPEWIDHVLSDESWATWRAENPARVEAMRDARLVDAVRR
jgi:hypothetical protein